MKRRKDTRQEGKKRSQGSKQRRNDPGKGSFPLPGNDPFPGKGNHLYPGKVIPSMTFLIFSRKDMRRNKKDMKGEIREEGKNKWKEEQS